jgi:hypothetical protein
MGSNPTGGMEVSLLCFVLSGRGLCDGLITSPEEFCRLWRVIECDISRNLVNEEALAQWGAVAQKEEEKNY